MATQHYVRSLVDPFNLTISQPKLLDGRVDRTAGLRFRTTGDITCKTNGPTYIALFAGCANVISWVSADTPQVPEGFVNHIGTTADTEVIDSLRIVSTALRLSLVNSSHENEGYWEAARIPHKNTDFIQPTTAVTPGGTATANRLMVDPTKLAAYAEKLSQYATFQSGKLRDLHRHQFKLNSWDIDHDFMQFSNPTNSPGSGRFDTIIIKIHGRVDATSPSVIHYDSVSNQEVVYNEGTVAARLMTRNVAIDGFDQILQKTNYTLPSVKIA